MFTTRLSFPLDATLVTGDLKRILTRTWIGGREECEHDRIRDRACAAAPLIFQLKAFHGLRHSCASLLLASGA